VRSEGSGLGLAIAGENARLHGGHIDAGNHPGGGAVFTVSLPLDAPVSLYAPFRRRAGATDAAAVLGRWRWSCVGPAPSGAGSSPLSRPQDRYLCRSGAPRGPGAPTRSSPV
jgi:hypothetical protein